MSLGIPHTTFQCYHTGTIVSLAMENPPRLFSFSCVLKPDRLDGAFQKGNFVGVFTLLNEYCSRPEVFIDQKKLRDCAAKIYWDQLSFFAEKTNESNTHVEMK